SRTVRPPDPSNSTIARRLGSPRASKGSPEIGSAGTDTSVTKMLPLADHHPRRENDVKSYEASSTISAKPDAIWGILTDGANYAHWDSGVERVEGRIAPGETIKVFVKVKELRAFCSEVIEFKLRQRMVCD